MSETVIRSVCGAGCNFKVSKIEIDPFERQIILWCDFDKCSFRGTQGCTCKDDTEASAVIISIPKTLTK